MVVPSLFLACWRTLQQQQGAERKAQHTLCPPPAAVSLLPTAKTGQVAGWWTVGRVEDLPVLKELSSQGLESSSLSELQGSFSNSKPSDILQHSPYTLGFSREEEWNSKISQTYCTTPKKHHITQWFPFIEAIFWHLSHVNHFPSGSFGRDLWTAFISPHFSNWQNCHHSGFKLSPHRPPQSEMRAVGMDELGLAIHRHIDASTWTT